MGKLFKNGEKPARGYLARKELRGQTPSELACPQAPMLTLAVVKMDDNHFHVVACGMLKSKDLTPGGFANRRNAKRRHREMVRSVHGPALHTPAFH